MCQLHGSSRNVTLKSSCGHSMVPTARAHAGVCLEHTASSVAGTLSMFARVFAQRLNFRVLLLRTTSGFGDGGNMLKACQSSKDSAIIRQNPAYSLHMHVSDL